MPSSKSLQRSYLNCWERRSRVFKDIAICAQELVVAVFRLAVADYLGIAYGHDEPGPNKYRQINPKVQCEAANFLTSQWATHLAELAGFSAETVWKCAQPERLRENDLRRAA